MFDRLFGRKKKLSDEEIEKLENAAYETKSAIMQEHLGPEHDHVMHAMIPYAIGGALDLYYFPEFRGGTAVATKELTDYTFSSPKSDWFDGYEFVMCTRNGIDLDSVHAEDPPPGSFAADHANINAILNLMARYTEQATLNPFETIEFPEEMEEVGGKCLILHHLNEPKKDERTAGNAFGLMLILEIHRAEMEFAMKQRGKELIAMLQEKEIYPFSYLDRESVV